MVRAKIKLITGSDITNFVNALNGANFDSYKLESGDGKYVVSAKSLLGVIYMSTEHSDDMWLINETNDGNFPNVIDCFRA